MTYLLSVYNALLRATSLALAVTTFLGRRSDEDGIDVVCRAVCTGSESAMLSWLGQTINELASTSQAQRQYPLIAFFHTPTDDRALPLALSDMLEFFTTCRALLDPDQHPHLSSSPTTLAAWRTAAQFVTEHGAELGRGGVPDARKRGREEYEAARARLLAAGVAVQTDAQARAQFLELHNVWHADVQRLGAPLPLPGPLTRCPAQTKPVTSEPFGTTIGTTASPRPGGVCSTSRRRTRYGPRRHRGGVRDAPGGTAPAEPSADASWR